MSIIHESAMAIKQADALLIGASNGLSIAEGYHIFANNDMFRSQFGDFQRKYGIRNVIEGCFFNYPDQKGQEAFLKCLIRFWIDEYQPTRVMRDLLDIVNAKDYFILTSNADTHLELSGFLPEKVFEVEGTFHDVLMRRHPVDKSENLNVFLDRYHDKRLVILELGIGKRNRLIKQPLMRLAEREPLATYITLNLEDELFIPNEIAHKSFGIAGDIAVTLHELKKELA